jgi:hypothetical protein
MKSASRLASRRYGPYRIEGAEESINKNDKVCDIVNGNVEEVRVKLPGVSIIQLQPETGVMI